MTKLMTMEEKKVVQRAFFAGDELALQVMLDAAEEEGCFVPSNRETVMDLLRECRSSLMAAIDPAEYERIYVRGM